MHVVHAYTNVPMHLCMYNCDACVNAYDVPMYLHMDVQYPHYDNIALVHDQLAWLAWIEEL